MGSVKLWKKNNTIVFVLQLWQITEWEADREYISSEEPHHKRHYQQLLLILPLDKNVNGINTDLEAHSCVGMFVSKNLISMQ